MKAVAVFPEKRQVKLIDVREPQISNPYQVKLKMLEVGVCGTDREICAFVHGEAVPGSDYFILGHESLAEVIEVGSAVEHLCPGDLAVGIVRLPCSEPECVPCRQSHQDFCITGKNPEHGVRGLDGFMTEYVVEAQPYLHRIPAQIRDVGVLTEPLTIAEKGFAEIQRIQSRLPFEEGSPRRALVLGAGPIGLLGAMKMISANYETYVYSLLPADSAGGKIAAAIGATYICSGIVAPPALREMMGSIDVVYEAIGAGQTAFDVLRELSANGVYVFTGVPRDQRLLPFDTKTIISRLVLQNQAVVGIVTAASQAFTSATSDLSKFEQRWPDALRALITQRYPLEAYHDAIVAEGDGIKRVVAIGAR